MTDITDAELTAAYRSRGPKMPPGVPLPRQVLDGLRAVAELGASRGPSQESGQELYDRIERQYWAQNPEAVATDIAIGETVLNKMPHPIIPIGGAGIVQDVRDAGRTISVQWNELRGTGIVQNVLTNHVLRSRS